MNPEGTNSHMGMQFTVSDAPDLTIPEDLPLRGQLVDLKVHEFEWTDKDGQRRDGRILQWWFEVTDGQTAGGKYKGRKVKGETDAQISNHPRNKFRQWAEVLLNRELPVGAALDADDLLGLPTTIVVKHEKDKKDPAKFYERIDVLLPVSGGFDFNDEPPF